MPWLDQNTYVIYDENPEKLKNFLEKFIDEDFKEEKHGDGPTHFACVVAVSGGTLRVLEIYPKKPKEGR